MSRIMNYASDLDVPVMQHPEDHESKVKVYK